ncbi:UvrD-helicase domain-containing protein [Arenicella xantha]|uniref:DNA 3'-5' helicase n=1 Tax=Arenicella xantha TaxID=644221 RepID=A0A395JP09_9GAMM|nr:UvrD-helicase domain-containing protein [Arenicella xantha]RBP53400.1 ATP-dependent exoDNAse (exonuclease V) beta subunit [Arenicella xantha]
MINDYQARQDALDPERSFIVQAPAGSGKTGLLVYRLLTLLARVDQPQQVLAITFTRKATAEMRARLMELLSDAAHGEEADNAFDQQGLDLAKAVLARDQQQGWQLLDAPYQLQILTIDAFCAKLTGSMPWLSRLGDRPRTTDRADVHYAAAIEQLFAELLEPESSVASALQAVLLELDFNYDKARRLFTSMLAKRDQWLRHLVQGDLLAMRSEVESAWYQVECGTIDRVREALPYGVLADLVRLGAEAAAKRIEKYGPGSPLDSLLDLTSADDLTISHWKAVCHLLLTGENFRKTVNITLGFEAKSDQREQMLAVLKNVSDDPALALALLDVQTLPDSELSLTDWQQLQSLELVLKALAGFLQLRFRASGECDHSEVTQRANLALRELENPTDLGLRLDTHLQHILVDEFQDTSHGQIELLKRLTAGWEIDESPPKTLFLVGDPMQSIYRFREADVSLFLQVADNDQTRLFPNIAIEALTLSENFRSSSDLVSWFNHTFQHSFPNRNNVLTGAITYSAASCDRQQSGPQVDYLLTLDDAHEATLIVEQVQAAINALPDDKAQVAILVRTRTQLNTLLPALQQADIHYLGVDIQPLHALPAVIDVMSLCKAICRDDDRVSWLSLLRGPWCGLSLVELKHLSDRPEPTVWEQLLNLDFALLNAESRSRLTRFKSVMLEVMAQRQQVSLAGLTRWAWHQLGGEATGFEATSEDIDTVFELIDSLQRGGDLPSMRELEEAMAKLYARPQVARGESKARVVVSTMHKSKGLQYHTVILPCLSRSARSSDKDVLMWAEHQDDDGDSRLLLAPFSAQQDSGSHYDYLRKLESKRDSNEAIRLMYVACTRAESKLILSAKVKLDPKTNDVRAPAKNSLLSTVWGALEPHFQLSESGTPSPQVTDTDMDQTLYRLPSDYSPNLASSVDWQVATRLHAQPSAPDEQVEYEWATQVATGVGIVLHDWLQFNRHSVLTAEVDELLRRRWRAELLSLRVPEDRLSMALRRLENGVKAIQQDSDAHFLFDDYAIANNEYAIAAYEDGMVNTYRLDRTFVDQHGVRWIVDYKSTDTNRSDLASFVDEQVAQRHRPQLEKYGALMRQIDTRPIKLAVYFPLLQQMRVWDFSG